MEINVAPPSPEFIIAPETVARIREQFFSDNTTPENFAKLKQKTEEDMLNEQPDLRRSIDKLAKRTKQPKAFWFGVVVGYSAISEKDRRKKLTRDEVKKIFDNRDDNGNLSIEPEDLVSKFVELQENLEKGSPDFFNLFESMVADIEQQSPDESLNFAVGALSTLYPFSTRTAFKEIDLVLPKYPRRVRSQKN